jgi:DNA-binding NarL/FixJ family response regulator
VAEASNGREALRQAAQHPADVVLMDIAMPELNGLEAAAQLKEQFPEVRVVILSMHANIEYARRAMQAGASGYLLKNAKAAELETALTAVAQGAIYLSPAVARIVAADYVGREGGQDPWRSGLTPREREVLRLVAAGRLNREIAEQLSVSERTVERHTSSLLRKLALRNRAELVSYAVRNGLVDPGNS